MKDPRTSRITLITAALAAAVLAGGCGASPGTATGTAGEPAGAGVVPASTTAQPPTTQRPTTGSVTPPAAATVTGARPTTAATGLARVTAPAGVWRAMARSPLPKLIMATGAWTGRELLVVGIALTKDGAERAAVAAYNPTTDRWRTLRAPSIGSVQGEPSAVWTGRELFLWGGPFHHMLNPATGRWRELDRIDSTPEGGHFALVWTGRAVLGWGGGCCGGNVGTGAAYDPVTNRWTALPPAPLSARFTSGAWTGTELVLVGGSDADGHVFADAAAYNPTTRRWRRLPSLPAPRVGATVTWAGDRLVVAGGYSRYPVAGHLVRGLAVWTPRSGTWRAVGSPEPGRIGHGAVWTGRQLLIWGGGVPKGDGMTPAAHGLAWRPATGHWTALPISPLRGRSGSVTVWTGRQLLVWGGTSGTTTTSWAGDGARFTPTAIR